MNPDQVKALVQSVLMVAGTALVTHGAITADQASALTSDGVIVAGGALALVGAFLNHKSAGNGK